jgi:hypothetical protein
VQTAQSFLSVSRLQCDLFLPAVLMDPAGSAYEGLYDPTKTKIPRRFQSKMPSLKHLKDNPCASLWSDVVECYALHSFDANACVSEMFAYNQCKKKVVRTDPNPLIHTPTTSTAPSFTRKATPNSIDYVIHSAMLPKEAPVNPKGSNLRIESHFVLAGLI